MINKYSETWREIEAFIREEMNDAIGALIADRYSEQQRGAIAVLERLTALADEQPQPIREDDYQ